MYLSVFGDYAMNFHCKFLLLQIKKILFRGEVL